MCLYPMLMLPNRPNCPSPGQGGHTFVHSLFIRTVATLLALHTSQPSVLALHLLSALLCSLAHTPGLSVPL